MLRLPELCSSAGSSSVSPHAPDFAAAAAASSLSEVSPRLSRLGLESLLLQQQQHRCIYPSSFLPQYYGKQQCCCCACTDAAASSPSAAAAAARRPPCQQQQKLGCCCCRCSPLLPQPTQHTAAARSAALMVKRMLMLRSAEESSESLSATASREATTPPPTEAKAAWPFPAVEPWRGRSTYVDTGDICPGEDGLLQAGTGFCRMSPVASLVRLFRYLLKAVVGCRDCEASLAYPFLQQLCRGSAYLASRSVHFFASFTPLLHSYLQTCAAQQQSAPDVLKDLWIEFSLLAPARLKHLLPHMGYLVYPLLRSLRSSDADLLTLSLRTIELWVEHLHADFVYPVLASQLGLDRVVCLVLQLLQHADADRAAASLCYASEPLLTSVGSRIAAHPQQQVEEQRLEPHAQVVRTLRRAIRALRKQRRSWRASDSGREAGSCGSACGTSDLESDASGSEQSSSKGSEKKGRDIAHAASSEMQTKETAEKGLQLLQGLFAADDRLGVRALANPKPRGYRSCRSLANCCLPPWSLRFASSSPTFAAIA
ncbi:hypothetical protein cyc_03568 [Cyclospora cayetanensis]|uniref:Uncharacterized protein n=1 Tax=Cyclospora cayetanensis TaxID=88456 RepID=A0A1D3CW03_9EIME|nr:hypothetical protein cyc_03568 [Cyclospora cayetanensis]